LETYVDEPSNNVDVWNGMLLQMETCPNDHAKRMELKPQKWEVNESKLMIEGTEKAGRLHDHEPCNDIGILIGCMACAAGTASPNNNLKTQAPRTFM
jgi:hypothetical protein